MAELDTRALPLLPLTTGVVLPGMVVTLTIESDEARQKAETYTNFLYDVVRDEDYKTGLDIQKGLASGANTHFTFGRNELTLQRFHGWVDRLLAGTGADG